MITQEQAIAISERSLIEDYLHDINEQICCDAKYRYTSSRITKPRYLLPEFQHELDEIISRLELAGFTCTVQLSWEERVMRKTANLWLKKLLFWLFADKTTSWERKRPLLITWGS